MDQRNPYAPPNEVPGSSEPERADARPVGPRSPGEFVILGSLIGSLLYLGYLIVSGSIRIEGYRPLVIAIVAIFIALGLLSLWLIARRRSSGAIACMAFYGAQVISVTFPSGIKLGFNSLPTIYFRIWGDSSAPTNLNIVALVFFVLSIALWQMFRGAQMPPNTSLERTRER
jgi:hypothetical protein